MVVVYQKKYVANSCPCPGKDNVEADAASRDFNIDLEWKLDPDIFAEICKWFGLPDIDIFALRVNYQMKPYISWYSDQWM